MKNTESINMQTDEKQPNPNDSKTIKHTKPHCHHYGREWTLGKN